MDFIKKILKMIENSTMEEFNDSFTQFLNNNGESQDRVVTMSTTSDGLILMSIFTPEQWDMAMYISEVTEKDIEVVVAELSADGDIDTIVIDPTGD